MSIQKSSQSAGDAMKAATIYGWWQRALEFPDEIGKAKDLKIHDDLPHAGYYMRPHIDAKPGSEYSKPRPEMVAEPVAIWQEGSGHELTYKACIGVDYRPIDALKVWTWVCRDPITEEEYRRLVAGGELPPKYQKPQPKEERPKKEPEKPAEPVAVKNAIPLEEQARIGIGHNQGPPLGPEAATEIGAKIKGESVLITKLIKEGVTDQETADKLGEAGNRMLKLSKEAAEKHKEAKAPYLEMSRKIDAAFKPLIDAAKSKMDEARGVIGAWAKIERDRLAAEEAKRVAAENARIAEENRKREEEAREKEEAARAEAARKAREAAELAGASDEEVEAAGAEAAQTVKPVEAKLLKEKTERKVEAKAGTAAGRAFGGKAKRTVGEITDTKAFVMAVIDDPAIVEAAQRVADRIARDKDVEDANLPAGMVRKIVE